MYANLAFTMKLSILSYIYKLIQIQFFRPQVHNTMLIGIKNITSRNGNFICYLTQNIYFLLLGNAFIKD